MAIVLHKITLRNYLVHLMKTKLKHCAPSNMMTFSVLPKMMTSNHKSKWMHQTADKNKGNGCQTCSLKIDLLAIVMNYVKKKGTFDFLVYSQS